MREESHQKRDEAASKTGTHVKRERLHRTTFVLAGCYNIGWGLYSSLDPQWLFRFADLPLLNHPTIFATLAMVIGVYGILYLEVARRPSYGFSIAAIGFLGKLLGPIGWAYLYFSGAWPIETILLILTNDLIWWIPFGIYLADAKGEYLRTFREEESGK